MTHRGSCHCGRIAFEIDGQIAQVDECNCSHCRGYLLWFTPREHLRLQTSDLAIQHHFCPTCGCAPFGFVTQPQGNSMAAVNVRCLPDLDRLQLTVRQVDGRCF